MSVPLIGSSIRELERIETLVRCGVRALSTSASGWVRIAPGYAQLPVFGTRAAPVTCVRSTLSDGERRIAAAVWDLVAVKLAGQVGRVTAFRAGKSSNGEDDVYVVETPREFRVDHRLMPDAALGFAGDAAAWRLAAKESRVVVTPHVRVELRAAEIELYTAYRTTDDVCKLIVMPRTAGPGGVSCSWCTLRQREGAGAEIGASTLFASHAWKYDFASVCAVLREHVDAADDAAAARVWFDVATLDQHAAAKGTYVSSDGDFWFSAFSDAIARIGHTVCVFSPWRLPISVTRAWCLYEIAASVGAGVPVTIALSARERIDFEAALLHRFGDIAAMLAAVDLRAAEGGGDDHARIMAYAANCAGRGACPGGRGDPPLQRRARHPAAAVCVIDFLLGRRSLVSLHFTCAGSGDGVGALNAIILAQLRSWVLGAARTALATQTAARGGVATRELLLTARQLNWLTYTLGQLSEAEPLMRATLGEARALLGRDHLDTLAMQSDLAWVAAARLGASREALRVVEPLTRGCLDGARKTLGCDHATTLR